MMFAPMVDDKNLGHNAGKGMKNYIAGPLRRIDSRGDMIKFDPPREDVLSLCLSLSAEVLASLRGLLKQKGDRIPVAEEADFRLTTEASPMHDFIPDGIKKMIYVNKKSIEASFKGMKIDVVPQMLSAIASVEKLVADVRA